MIRSALEAVRTYSPDVRRIMLVSALMAFTIDGVFPVIFNLYILRMGYDPEFVGLVNSVALVVFAVASLPSGSIGARWGARVALIWGAAISLVSTVALAASDIVPRSMQPAWLMVGFSLLYVGSAFYFVNAAPALVNSSPMAERPRVISTQSALTNFLAFIGGPLAGFIPVILISYLGWPEGSPAAYRVPLLVSAALYAVATVLITTIRPIHVSPDEAETPVGGGTALESSPSPASPATRRGAPPVAIAFGGTLVIISLVRFLQAAGSGSGLTFFNVYMDDGLGVSTATIGIFVAIARLASVFISFWVPAVTRKIGAGRGAVAASAGVGLSLIPLALIPNWVVGGTSFVAMNALTSVRYSTYFVYMMEVTPPQLRTLVAGAGEFAGGLSFALVSFIGGFVIVRIGYPALFLGSALVTLMGSALLWGYLVWRKVRLGEEPRIYDVAAPVADPASVAALEAETP